MVEGTGGARSAGRKVTKTKTSAGRPTCPPCPTLDHVVGGGREASRRERQAADPGPNVRPGGRVHVRTDVGSLPPPVFSLLRPPVGDMKLTLRDRRRPTYVSFFRRRRVSRS